MNALTPFKYEDAEIRAVERSGYAKPENAVGRHFEHQTATPKQGSGPWTLIPFEYEGAEIRVVEQSGELWFVAKDVCDALDISKHRDAIARLDGDETCPVRVDGKRGARKLVAVNESGLFTLILRSDKPEARRFRKWVTSEVLPTIRKTGSYTVPRSTDSLQATRAFRSYRLTAKALGFKGNQAVFSAARVTERQFGINVLELFEARHLVADQQSPLLNATDLGKRVGLNRVEINPMLEALGFIRSYRDLKNRKQWELTKAGEAHGLYLDTGKQFEDGTPIRQIKWNLSVIPVLEGNLALV